jgi:hypothetical protein
MTVSSQDKLLLKKLSLAEARGEGVVGQALVIRSVLNRQAVVKSGNTAFGRDSSIRGIVYAPSQYAPTRDGSLDGRGRPWTAQELALAEEAYQLALNPAELQRQIESDGVSSTTARGLVLSTGFDSLGGQGRSDQITYRGHVFVQNANNYGVTGDSIYRSSATSQQTQQQTATDPATNAKTEETKPVPVPDKELKFDNQFGQLSNDEIDAKIEENRKEIDKLNEKSSDLWTEEEKEKYKEISAETDALIKAKVGNDLQEGIPEECNVRETAKGFTFKDTPPCEKYFNSVAFRDAITRYQTERDLPDPCGTSEMSKINTELQKFFTVIKGIKKYGDLYVNGTINKLQNITALIRSSSQIISAVLKTLVNRLRDFLLDKIRKGIEDLIDIILPTIAKTIKNTVIQAVVDNIFCAFKNVIKGLPNLVTDFLFELIGKIVNVPFCAAQQFTNALINNIAAIVDKSIGPVLDQINDVLGGVTRIVGNVFQALDYILGFEAFLCAKPNCPEIKKFKASPWGGPTQAQIDDFAGFLAPLGGRQTPTAEGIIGSATDFIDGIEIFGQPLGDSAGKIPSNVTNCDVSAFKCGPPSIQVFGGGGVGAVAEAIVDNVGKTIGINLINGGSGYTRPPFVSFVDSCEDTFTSGYAIISESGTNRGQVVDIILTTAPTPAPPRDGRTEFDPPSDIVEQPSNDFVVCLEGFRILDTGVGYTVNDSIAITPDIPGLTAAVQLTEFGQIVSIQIESDVCGLGGYPEIEINSQTGEGAVIEPILSFTPVAEFNETADTGIGIDRDPQLQLDGPIDTLRGRNVLVERGFTRKDLVRVVDCVS